MFLLTDIVYSPTNASVSWRISSTSSLFALPSTTLESVLDNLQRIIVLTYQIMLEVSSQRCAAQNILSIVNSSLTRHPFHLWLAPPNLRTMMLLLNFSMSEEPGYTLCIVNVWNYWEFGNVLVRQWPNNVKRRRLFHLALKLLRARFSWAWRTKLKSCTQVYHFCSNVVIYC